MPRAAKVAPVETRNDIPDKLYFRIGEVSRLAGVKAYVLRYWETEFSALAPKKSGTNHRLYRRKEVELILEIKRLLYEKRYTIEGARKFLEARGKAETPPPAAVDQGQLFLSGAAGPLLDVIHRELTSLLVLLK